MEALLLVIIVLILLAATGLLGTVLGWFAAFVALTVLHIVTGWHPLLIIVGGFVGTIALCFVWDFLTRKV